MQRALLFHSLECYILVAFPVAALVVGMLPDIKF